jgi:hypothetical protein
MAGPGARRCRLGLSSCVRSRLSGVFRALRFAGFASGVHARTGGGEERGKRQRERERERERGSQSDEEKPVLATLSPPLIHAYLAAMRSRADQVTRPHAAHGLHISFVHTHAQAQRVRLLGAPAAPWHAAAATMQRSQRYRTGLCLCWGFRQPATQRGARERARWGARAARTHLHRTRGLRHRTRGLLLLIFTAPGRPQLLG